MKTYKQFINEAMESNLKSAHHELFRKHGFTEYNHGPNHKGFIDKSESKVTIHQAHDNMVKHGYKLTSKDKTHGGYTHYSYTRAKDGPAGKVAPYHEEHYSFDTTNGTHVRNVDHQITKDNS